MMGFPLNWSSLEAPDDALIQYEFEEIDWLPAAVEICERTDAETIETSYGTVYRDNRAARLKSCGNSIVPQVAFEIFEAINAVEVDKNLQYNQ